MCQQCSHCQWVRMSLMFISSSFVVQNPVIHFLHSGLSLSPLRSVVTNVSHFFEEHVIKKNSLYLGSKKIEMQYMSLCYNVSNLIVISDNRLSFMALTT